MKPMKMLLSIAVGVTATIALVETVVKGQPPNDKPTGKATTQSPQTASEPEPRIEDITISELTSAHDGKEVTVAFEVAETYRLTGSVPVGQYPSFGIRPVLPPGSPRFSVLVSGDLSGIMERFGMLDAGPHSAKGRWIQATGKITVFPVEKKKGTPSQEPSYQLNLRDWKRFRMLPAPTP